MIQFLSLDVVLGSIAVGIFATSLLEVSANPVWWIILPVALWIIYNFDHLMDGYKSKGMSQIQRHNFHFKYRKIFILLIALLSFSSFLLCYLFMDSRIWFYGTALFILISLYFVMVFYLNRLNYLFFQKELLIALIYVCGIFLAPLVWSNSTITGVSFLIISKLCVLAWMDGVTNAYFDKDKDVKDGNKSFATHFGLSRTRKILIATQIVLSAGIITLLFFAESEILFAALLIELCMCFILMVIISFPVYFSKNERYRLLGESIFLLPALLYLVK